MRRDRRTLDAKRADQQGAKGFRQERAIFRLTLGEAHRRWVNLPAWRSPEAHVPHPRTLAAIAQQPRPRPGFLDDQVQATAIRIAARCFERIFPSERRQSAWACPFPFAFPSKNLESAGTAGTIMDQAAPSHRKKR